MSNHTKPTLYLGSNVTIRENIFDFGNSSAITAQTPQNNYDVANKMYVDDIIDIERKRINNIESGIDINLQKLKDLKAWLDTLNNNDITSTIIDMGIDITQLKSDINKEEIDRKKAIDSILVAIAGETNDRTLSNNEISKRIDTIKSVYDKYIYDNNTRSANIEGDILNEIETRIAADNVIKENILRLQNLMVVDINIAKTDAKRYAMNLNNNEIIARTDADLALSAKIETETTDRKNSDSTLQDNIDAEETARINKDNQLENKITELTSILDKLKTDTTVTLSTYAAKINYLYLAFYNRSMDEAIGIDQNNNIIFQYGPSII
jgi:hypothetical protein